MVKAARWPGRRGCHDMTLRLAELRQSRLMGVLGVLLLAAGCAGAGGHLSRVCWVCCCWQSHLMGVLHTCIPADPQHMVGVDQLR
eukprot:1160545-Pelagomonas_calceolata.AAC.6